METATFGNGAKVAVFVGFYDFAKPLFESKEDGSVYKANTRPFDIERTNIRKMIDLCKRMW